ncbi:unnamed protein product [Mytilus coruscus]|uniref:B box-type domain-containing protein n=1 Tax=Mytilus coruscus TaxID=42192 RepID=A0A6J8BRE2_MYTCO|nr:unnamed protein product [Mytilus coruscus]
MLPDGRLVFTYCDEKTVKVFNIEGAKDFEVKIPFGAFDIEYIGVNSIPAVTSGASDKQCLTIIDLERKLIKKTISLSSDNYGISTLKLSCFMVTFSQSCGVCDLRLITKPCIVWCTECDEGLCKECQEHHRLSKASRNHSVIPFTDYEKLPTDVLKISQYCSKHNKKFEMFCQKHEHPCCSKCIVESHKECRDIVDLDDVIKNYETPNALFEIEKTLVEVADNLQKIRQRQHDNMSTLKEKRKEIEKEIKKTRTEISNYLDKLQEDLMKQLNAIEEKENSKIVQLLSSIEKKEKEVEECQKNIINIKQHATNLQMFLSVKQIEEDVSSKDKFLNSLFEGEDLNQHFMEFEINGVFQKIMFDIKSFGDVHIEEKPADIVLSRKKAKEAQIIVPIVQSRSIENIKMKINKKINLQGKRIYGCCMLPDGRLVFTYNREGKVSVFNYQG